MHRRLPLIAALVLTACATPAPDGIAAPAAPVGDADMLAYQLDAAARADATDDLAALRAALVRIDELGAKPSDDASAAQLAGWRARLPDLPPMRGRTLGPGYRSGVLGGGRQLTLEQTFLAGQSAAVAFSTSSGRRLELEIRNNGGAVCSETGERRACRWIPTFSTRHAIALRNPGRERVRYFLVID